MPATPASSSHWSMLVELARVDTRSRLATDAACAQAAALVARERERVARLRIRRAALVLVIEGSKELVRGGRSVLLTAGRAIGLPAGWTGDVVNVPNDTSGIYRALFVDFPPDLVTRALRAHWCTFGLADAKPRSGVVFASPSSCRDGHVRWPEKGPDETRRAAGAGRTGRTTGCSA